MPEYLKPALDKLPPYISAVADYEALAVDFIAPASHAYIAGGSGDEITLRANRDAFARIGLHSRLLRDCTQGSTATTLLGQSLRHPILLAPVAFQTLVHGSGELATAQAAEAMEACLVVSTLASFSLEQIAAASSAPKWFQLYFQPRREYTLDLVRRAENAGYRALVVTLDTPVQSVNRRARRAGFVMPADVVAANLARYAAPSRRELPPHQSVILQGMMSEAPLWRDLAWLMSQTSLPVVVKGALHVDDARQLRDAGVAGIVVSNHGGRALDGVAASLQALPDIRSALGPDFPLLLDGGIRSGSDVFKALALGANAVLVGRPQVYALAVAGALGVAHMLRLLRDELELCMALTGCADIAGIGGGSVFRHAMPPV